MKLVDSNIIIRFFVRDNEKMYEKVKRLFKSVDAQEEKIEVKAVVLFECVYVFQSYYKLPRDKIADIMSKFISFKGVFIRKKKMYLYAFELYKNTKFDLADCYLASELKFGNIREIYSFDKDFDKLGVRRVEP